MTSRQDRDKKALRSVATVLVAAAIVAGTGVASNALDALLATPASAEPLDCAPVGVETIDGVVYYVENCFGYNIYRPL